MSLIFSAPYNSVHNLPKTSCLNCGEQFYNKPDLFISKNFTRLAKLKFRNYNELTHLFEERLKTLNSLTKLYSETFKNKNFRSNSW